MVCEQGASKVVAAVPTGSLSASEAEELCSFWRAKADFAEDERERATQQNTAGRWAGVRDAFTQAQVDLRRRMGLTTERQPTENVADQPRPTNGERKPTA